MEFIKESLTSPLQNKSTKTFAANLAKKLVRDQLSKITAGQLQLEDGEEKNCYGAAQGPKATIFVHDVRFYSELAYGGSIGASEAYMLGYWSCDDLTNLVRIMCINQSTMDALEGGYAWLKKPILKTLHWLNANSVENSKKNIAAHYDLGNDFFKLFLDSSMMYSCAIFENPSSSLDEASIHKLQVICEKLQLKPNDHLLEIGSGWGGLAIYAAKNFGCKVTTTTISQQQFAYAQERIRHEGLQDRVTILKEDYRNLNGTYDKIVSVEMIEAIGHQYYDTYFHQVGKLLKADGLALIQAITIRDQRYQSALKSVDFIQRYIFPGSCIPSNTAMLNSITTQSDLTLIGLEDIGMHYTRTLLSWRERFFANIEAVRALGYSEEFIRMWDFYFCYCAGGFAERALGDVHLLLAKPDYRML